jgi:Domain of unknown function (DUF222)/HNH endonuclease
VSTDRTIEQLDGAHAEVSSAHRRFLRTLAEADRAEIWLDRGARDMAHFVSMRYGVSWWRAERWISAAHALEQLPSIADALAAGEISLDKTIELTRIATPHTESRLLRWARGASVAAIRRRADAEATPRLDQAVEAERARSLSWWWGSGGLRLWLQGSLPAADGAQVIGAIERIARDLPIVPGEEPDQHGDARRADALVALCTTAAGSRVESERPAVVLHAQASAFGSEPAYAELELGGVAHPETARRLACSARIQAVLEDAARNPVTLGRTAREPSEAMMRALRYRDSGCRFPGCGNQRFTHAHHLVWWGDGGRTDLDNLILLCTFHHKLVHELGWTVRRSADGALDWRDRGGRPYRSGPAPPDDGAGRRPLAAVGSS